MTRDPSVVVGATAVSFGVVWVHLQPVKEAAGALSYCITVGRAHVNGVFDLAGRRGEQSWPDYIASDVAQLGSFILEGYVDRLVELTRSERRPYEWVVATLDRVEETPDSLQLIGLAVPFIARPIELVPLFRH
ncbi:MAG: hypothetical protein K2Y37_01395 [Pirellulales bacterium]|nr:hypothetical protein [Pirellulales bacterium]